VDHRESKRKDQDTARKIPFEAFRMIQTARSLDKINWRSPMDTVVTEHHAEATLLFISSSQL
jgi:hypothetical protein